MMLWDLHEPFIDRRFSTVSVVSASYTSIGTKTDLDIWRRGKNVQSIGEDLC